LSLPRDILTRMTDSLDRLYEAALAVQHADPAKSRTAKLLRAGRDKMAKKPAEEAVEVVIDAINGRTRAVVKESADLMYNLVVGGGRSAAGRVWAEMARRERLFGIAEKLPRSDLRRAPRRRIIALEPRRVRKRS
jgi:phosphoribosyl-ATP pyrophosphohydrolase